MASSNPQESLFRATSGESTANYAAIIRGFTAKGIPEREIEPRVNVFTFNAWKANGRIVKRGEHGVRCVTFIEKIDRTTGQKTRRPWSTTVFHISQTETVEASNANRVTPRRAQNTYETMSDEALAALAASGRGKALVQLSEVECSAMMEQMRRAAFNPTLDAISAAEQSKTIDVTPIPPTASVETFQPRTATMVKTKGAWIREAGFEIGQPAPMYLDCECGQRLYRNDAELIECKCGIQYDRAGWITRPTARHTPTPQLPPISAADMRTARERVLAGEPVNILDLMPDKIDARPRGPQVILNGQPLKPQLKKRRLAF